MVTGHLVTAASETPLLVAWGVLELIAVVSWAVLFAVLLGFFVILIVSRNRAQRRRATAPPAAPYDGAVRSQLDALRRADPDFDEQLLLEAAQTAALLIFAAVSAGDDAPINWLATTSFWATPFGNYVSTAARDRQQERAQAAASDTGPSRNKQMVPLDYLASLPQLAAITLGPEQRVSVRVSFSQLQAIVRPDAMSLAAGAAAGNLLSAVVSLAKAISAQVNQGPVNVSWVSAAGRYDLIFERPAGTLTDPSAALASRTCNVCGATYTSEFATACAHCGAERSLPWGLWRLAESTPVT